MLYSSFIKVQIWRYLKTFLVRLAPKKHETSSKDTLVVMSKKKIELQQLWWQLELWLMKNNENIGEYISILSTLTNETIWWFSQWDKNHLENIKNISVNIEETKDLDNTKIKDFQSTLVAHEMKVDRRETRNLTRSTSTP